MYDSAGDEFMNVAVGSLELLPGRSWLAEQLDARPSQFLDGSV